MKFNKEVLFYLIAAFFFGVTVMLLAMQLLFPYHKIKSKQPYIWQIESIDTMKNSRDLALQDLSSNNFQDEVNNQMAKIAATGANYVAIDTPYDAKFLPVLKVWVQAARNNGLHVWFRGNFSGWEGWFNFPPITQEQHIAMTRQFILSNKDLFQPGDIFTSCPECENGIHLDISDPQAVAAYRQFLITEYNSDQLAFNQIGVKVNNGFFSMNDDVAKAVMDRQTTQELGGVVVIDHYVQTPDDLLNGVEQIAQQSGGKVVLGEFGVPIPNINGSMTDQEQSDWISQALNLLKNDPDLLGMNYWVNKGGSTALWNQDDSPRPAVSVISKYYQNNL
jgi:hypothetical protein